MNFEDYEIQNKTRKKESLFTVADDDGRPEVMSFLKPVAEKHGVPITITVPVGLSHNRITKEDMLHLQNDLGWKNVAWRYVF